MRVDSSNPSLSFVQLTQNRAQRYPARTTLSDDETCVIQTISNPVTLLIFTLLLPAPKQLQKFVTALSEKVREQT